ncbi:Exocyst complex component 5 [Thecaphora frezii]
MAHNANAQSSPKQRPTRTFRPPPAQQPALIPSRTSSSSHSHSLSTSSARPYHDSTVNELCTLETFQNSFNTNDFIAQLSTKLVQRSKADPGPFNPRPFIRTFEAALEQLTQIRTQVTAQTQVLSSSVHVAESAYTKKLDELSKNFVAVGNSFSSLEDRISEVGRTAIRIGEQLETIDRQRNRASEAHDLIEFYYMFARGDTSKLERVRKEGGKEGRMKTAVIARRLAAISREVDVKGSEQTRDAIDRYCERFERDMLKLFDKFYRKSDPKMMSHIAKVMQGFNGGDRCVRIYVNQHDFFISKDRVGEASTIEDSEIWKHLADPDQPPPKTEPALSSLFAEIRQTVEIEAQIISAVFPNPLVVLQTFLQRVFAQSVGAFVEVMMGKAGQISAPSFVTGPGVVNNATGTIETQAGSTQPPTSHLAFLRALHLSRSSALALVNDLKLYDFRGAGIVAPTPSQLSAGGVSESGSLMLLGGDGGPGGQMAHAGASPLATMLDHAVEELFVPYMEGVRYLVRETRNLTDLYAGYLAKFFAYHKTPNKPKPASNTIFNRMRSQISSSATEVHGQSAAPSTATTTTSAMSGAKSSFFKLSGLADRVRGGSSQAPAAAPAVAPPVAESTDAVDPIAEELELEREGDLSLDVAERMLRWHAEAIGRCVDLSSSSEVPKATFALLKVLTSAYIKTYIEAALDSAIATVTAQDVRGPQLPDLSLIGVIRNVEMLVALWQHYVNTALVPLASTSVTVRREMVIFNNHNLLRVEGKCDALMQKLADNVVNYLSNRLATQKKNDFTPKNDELAFSRMNTEPCISCSEALEKVQQVARVSLSSTSTEPLAASGSCGSGRPGSGRPGSSGTLTSRSITLDDDGSDALAHGAGGLATGRTSLSRNAESFLTEIGVAFHGLLLEHLRKFTVSPAGGLMLTKDLAMYQDAIGTFGIPALSDRFEMLRQLGNLFIVQASVLKSYMRESHLAKIDERLIRPYLLRRADYAREVRDLDHAAPMPRLTTGDGLAGSALAGGGSSSGAAAGGRDLFGHLPSLVGGSSASAGATGPLMGSGSGTEAVKSQRLAEILKELESFSNAAAKGSSLTTTTAAAAAAEESTVAEGDKESASG